MLVKICVNSVVQYGFSMVLVWFCIVYIMWFRFRIFMVYIVWCTEHGSNSMFKMFWFPMAQFRGVVSTPANMPQPSYDGKTSCGGMRRNAAVVH